MKYIAMISLFLSCSHYQTAPYHPNYFMGDSSQESLINENGESVGVNDKEFNQMVCMRKKDFDQLTIKIIKCRGKE